MENSKVSKKLEEFRSEMLKLVMEFQDEITEATGSELNSSRPNLKRAKELMNLRSMVGKIGVEIADIPRWDELYVKEKRTGRSNK